jgi:diguanylate cyclase (GGDEF)-like protein/PAS domain S-box-containing protein
MITDEHNLIISVNQAFTETTGYSESEVKGKNPTILSSGMHDQQFYESMWDTINTAGRWRGEVWNRRKDGELYPESLNICTVKDSLGNIVNYIGLFSDITEHKKLESFIKHQAQHDFLTDLPNRILFHDRLEQHLASARRDKEMFAVLFLDLDNFKPINDSFGHRVGDLLLQEVATRLVTVTRETDTVSRQGGDEFIILATRIECASQAQSLADKLLDAISETFLIDGLNINVTFSIGIAIYPDDGESEEELTKNADSAMYLAKKQGRNSHILYSSIQQCPEI